MKDLWQVKLIPAVTAPKRVHLVEHLEGPHTADYTLCGRKLTLRSSVLVEHQQVTCLQCKRAEGGKVVGGAGSGDDLNGDQRPPSAHHAPDASSFIAEESA